MNASVIYEFRGTKEQANACRKKAWTFEDEHWPKEELFSNDPYFYTDLSEPGTIEDLAAAFGAPCPNGNFGKICIYGQYAAYNMEDYEILTRHAPFPNGHLVSWLDTPNGIPIIDGQKGTRFTLQHTDWTLEQTLAICRMAEELWPGGKMYYYVCDNDITNDDFAKYIERVLTIDGKNYRVKNNGEVFISIDENTTEKELNIPSEITYKNRRLSVIGITQYEHSPIGCYDRTEPLPGIEVVWAPKSVHYVESYPFTNIPTLCEVHFDASYVDFVSVILENQTDDIFAELIDTTRQQYYDAEDFIKYQFEGSPNLTVLECGGKPLAFKRAHT